MTADHVRDAAAIVAALAFLASAWCGWAQDRPPKTWRAPLALAAVASVLLAVVGGVLTWQRRSRGSAFDQERTAIGFSLVVGVGFAAAGIGPRPCWPGAAAATSSRC
jgi:hypothetical protein